MDAAFRAGSAPVTETWWGWGYFIWWLNKISLKSSVWILPTSSEWSMYRRKRLRQTRPPAAYLNALVEFTCQVLWFGDNLCSARSCILPTTWFQIATYNSCFGFSRLGNISSVLFDCRLKRRGMVQISPSGLYKVSEEWYRQQGGATCMPVFYHIVTLLSGLV